MSLPIYKAISLQEIIRKGGHTQPWIVTVKTKDCTLPYVVKLYTTEQINNYNSVTAEVIANQLAKEFDFNVPEAALIEFDEDFISNRNIEEQAILNAKDDRIKYGSLLLEPSQIFTSGLSKSMFNKRFNAGIDTLFAFDNFIRNSDRGNKPNLLFHKSDSWLIDHEKAFDTVSNANLEFEQWLNKNYAEYPNRFYEYHICYNYLRRTQKRKKIDFFEDFFYYLENLNINKLHSFCNQLEQQGYITNQQVINSYLQLIKDNSVIFETLLRYLIAK